MLRTTILALAVVSATPAAGQVQCGNHAAILEYGRAELGQYPVLTLNHPSGNEFVIISNPNTGSWTVLRTDGTTACIMAAGSGVTPAGMRL